MPASLSARMEHPTADATADSFSFALAGHTKTNRRRRPRILTSSRMTASCRDPSLPLRISAGGSRVRSRLLSASILTSSRMTQTSETLRCRSGFRLPAPPLRQTQGHASKTAQFDYIDTTKAATRRIYPLMFWRDKDGPITASKIPVPWLHMAHHSRGRLCPNSFSIRKAWPGAKPESGACDARCEYDET
jgi:hypothetical protein